MSSTYRPVLRPLLRRERPGADRLVSGRREELDPLEVGEHFEEVVGLDVLAGRSGLTFQPDVDVVTEPFAVVLGDVAHPVLHLGCGQPVPVHLQDVRHPRLVVVRHEAGRGPVTLG